MINICLLAAPRMFDDVEITHKNVRFLSLWCYVVAMLWSIRNTDTGFYSLNNRVIRCKVALIIGEDVEKELDDEVM